MSLHPCQNCGVPNEDRNYCDWECSIGCALKAGHTVHQPNGLPIRSIKADGSMWEHEHGDHPDYLFPVDVEYCGTDEDDFTWLNGDATKRPFSAAERAMFSHQEHALIYADRSIAVTMYECCYAMWYLRKNELGGGSLWKKGEWKLSEASLCKVRALKVP